MSILGDVIAAALTPTIAALWGEAVTYTPAGGSGSAITATFGELPDEDFHRKRRYTVQTSEVATSLRGDTVTDAAAGLWMVWRQEDAIGGLRHLECKAATTINYETAEGVTTAGVPAVRETLPDQSPATQGPLEQRLYFVATADLASAPDRIDAITDGGQVFKVFNFELAVDGMVKLYTKILQVRG